MLTKNRSEGMVSLFVRKKKYLQNVKLVLRHNVELQLEHLGADVDLKMNKIRDKKLKLVFNQDNTKQRPFYFFFLFVCF